MHKRKFTIDLTAHKEQSVSYLMGIRADARITTLQSIREISVEELHWQYADGWNTIGALLAHIIACEHWFRITFLEEREPTEAEMKELEPGLELGMFVPQLITNQPAEFYIAELEKSEALFTQQLQAVSYERFTKRIEDYDPVTGSNLAWVLYHVAEDEVHHRGQMRILRKLWRSIKDAQ